MVDIRNVYVGQRLLLNPTSNLFYLPTCINTIGVVKKIEDVCINMSFDNGNFQFVLPRDVDMIECREIDAGILNIKDLF